MHQSWGWTLHPKALLMGLIAWCKFESETPFAHSSRNRCPNANTVGVDITFGVGKARLDTKRNPCSWAPWFKTAKRLRRAARRCQIDLGGLQKGVSFCKRPKMVGVPFGLPMSTLKTIQKGYPQQRPTQTSTEISGLVSHICVQPIFAAKMPPRADR